MAGLSRLPRLWLAVPLGAVLACGPGDQAPTTGIDLEIHYDSSLEVEELLVMLKPAEGSVVSRTLTPPLDLDPPGLRQPHFAVELPDGPTGALTVHVDAKGALSVLGSGEVAVTVAPGQMVPALVVLGADDPCGPGGCPRCGNGRVEGVEQCDDGNASSDDECRPDCTSTTPITWTYESEVLGPISTVSTELVPVAGATLAFAPAAGEQWMIFLSGRVTSTSEAQVSSQVQLRINGVVRSAFGHQTYGGGEGWAGFLVFDLVSGGAPVSVSTYFGAIDGETRLADLRLVAARLPPGADPVFSSGPDETIAAGVDLELAAIRLNPPTPGRYLILAESTLSEAPGGDTAELWLVDERGERFPSDPRGAGWVNGRASELPAFVAIERELRGPESFRILATTSATNPDGWWDQSYARRLPITMSSEVDLPQGAQVSVTFDHAALVNEGLAQANGADLRVVTLDGLELERVLDDDSAFDQATTRLWFRSSAALSAGVDNVDHYLYYGNPVAVDPPADPQQVFDFYDDFGGTALDRRWMATGAPSLRNGQLVLSPGAGVFAVQPLAEDQLFEVRAQVTPGGDITEAVVLGAFEAVGVGDRLPAFGFGLSAQEYTAIVGGQATPFVPQAPESLQRWRLTRRGGEMILSQAFTERGRGPVVVDQVLNVGLGSLSEAELGYEWARARVSRGRDATLTLGAPEGLSGSSPSTFHYPRLLAFRLDAFPGASTQFDPALLSTTGPEPVILGRLSTPPPPVAAAHLVLQALRVAGDSNVAARKVGLLRTDGQTALETSLQISRDASRGAGYHHLAGLVDVRRTGASIACENAIASPDGITVEGAASAIVILRYPPR